MIDATKLKADATHHIGQIRDALEAAHKEHPDSKTLTVLHGRLEAAGTTLATHLNAAPASVGVVALSGTPKPDK